MRTVALQHQRIFSTVLAILPLPLHHERETEQCDRLLSERHFYGTDTFDVGVHEREGAMTGWQIDARRRKVMRACHQNLIGDRYWY